MVSLFPTDPPGKANITGPRYVLKGEEAVLICHIADKGMPYLHINTSDFLNFH